MCKNVPDHVVKDAAQKCVDANACKYSHFKRVLTQLVNRNEESKASNTHLPEHENIRGREYFK